MDRTPAVIFEERLRVPVSAHTLEGFRAWLRSGEFPEGGRIDFLAGDVEVEMSPEDLLTHGEPKVAIGTRLYWLVVEEEERGHVFIDRTRVELPGADLHVEPDVVVVGFDSLRSGQIRMVPAASRKTDRYVELQGAPDLVVEIVSDGSVRKDTQRFPELYARGGVPEYWLVDARGEAIELRLFRLAGVAYIEADADAEGWRLSPFLGLRIRLVRQRTPVQTWRYRLETAPAGGEAGKHKG
jgi:Uma2 family endonuclease